LAVTDWRLRRWRLWFLALSNAPLKSYNCLKINLKISAHQICHIYLQYQRVRITINLLKKVLFFELMSNESKISLLQNVVFITETQHFIDSRRIFRAMHFRRAINGHKASRQAGLGLPINGVCTSILNPDLI